MPRQAKLSKAKVGKSTYWTTTAGGPRVYFGNVKDVSRKDAETQFLDHLKKVAAAPVISIATVPVAKLIEEYLSWSKANLSAGNYATKKSCLEQFANYTVGSGGQEQFKRLAGSGKALHHLAAAQVTAGHLADFIATRKEQAARPGISPVRITQIKIQLAIDDRPERTNVNTAKRSAAYAGRGLGLGSRIGF